jgi:UrcA family protein
MNTTRSKSIRMLAAGAILSALALSFVTVSSADEATTAPQVTVKFADLDVSTSQGAMSLYRRIHVAADDVCSRMYTSTEYRWRKDACLQKVIANAVSKVNKPALSAVFASKYRISAPVVLASVGTR